MGWRTAPAMMEKGKAEINHLEMDCNWEIGGNIDKRGRLVA